MSFSASEVGVGGISVVADAPAAIGGGSEGIGAGGVDVPGVDVLAFTGTGPGTLPLAVLGAVSLVVGAFAAWFGRRCKAEGPEPPRNGLPDLSVLADVAQPAPADVRT